MATRATDNRPIVSWMFIAAGVLLLAQFVFSIAVPAMTSAWLFFLAWAALAVAFALLFVARPPDGLLRAAFIIAAIGWGLLALASVIPGFGTIGSLASFVALIGTLGAGILVFLRHFFTRNTDIVFLITTIVAALLLLNGIRGFLVGPFVTTLMVIFGAFLIAAGVFVQRRR